MKKYHVAIIGAGFAGLAVCYYLLRDFSHTVTLFDPKGIGGGGSGIAAGLLHPYPGKKSHLSWQGKEALQATKELLNSTAPSCYQMGLDRVALTDCQEKQFRSLAYSHFDVEWKHFPSPLSPQKGVFLSSGITVNVKEYLEGLWRACKILGASLHLSSATPNDLFPFDQVVIAAGAKSLSFFPHLPLKINKGQLLTCETPPNFPIKRSVIGNGYFACHPNWRYSYLGSTYEHSFHSELPCLATAQPLIFSRVAQFIPSIANVKIVRCNAALRAMHQKSYHPIADRITKKRWLFTGLGSRGLLYHAYLGQKLAKAIATQDPSSLPKEVRLKR